MKRLLKQIVPIISVAVWAGLPSASGDRIYYSTHGDQAIFHANLDRSDITEFLTFPFPDVPSSIALDTAAGKIYWVLEGGGVSRIIRANLDGTASETIQSFPDTKVFTITLDFIAEKIYWTAVNVGGEEPRISRSNFDGTELEDVLMHGFPRGIALDVAEGKMYFTNGSLGAYDVHRANLDGSNVEGLVPVSGEVLESIALDLTHRQMYWVDSSGGRIRRANLEGTDIEDVLTGLVIPVDIALDVQGNRMYWTDSLENIRRAELDGQNAEIFLGALDSVLMLALQIDCDNGVVDPGETCDTAIPAPIPGSCPSSCVDADPCTTDRLLDSESCSARCAFDPITAPHDGDGCCPPGANATSDSDCDPVPNNGVCEPGEDANNTPGDCFDPVPAASEWNLIILTLLLLTGARIRSQHNRCRSSGMMN